MKKLIVLMSVLIASLTANIALASGERSIAIGGELIHISIEDKKAKDFQAVQTLLNSVNLAKTARLNLDKSRQNTDISKMSMQALVELEFKQSLEYYPLIKNVNEATESFLLKNVYSAKDIQTGMKVARKIKSNDCSDDCASWYLCCCGSRSDRLSFDCEKEEKCALKAIELMDRE